MASDGRALERQYRLLRKQLDELGYMHSLPVDAISLVDKLVSDLVHTTDSLKCYKEIAKRSLEECSYFDCGFEPYKQENCKIVRECNDLHIQLLKTKEESEKQLKDLKSQLRKLQSENSDLQFLSSQHLHLVKELEKESAEKTLAILRLQNKTAPPVVITGNKKTPLRSCATVEIDAPLDNPKLWRDNYCSVTAQIKNPHIVNMVELCDQRICALSREVNLLTEERSQLSEKVLTLESKIVNRDREIERLQNMLEGGRPLSAISKDFGLKEMEIQLNICREEVKKLESENKELQATLKETVASQHEAMTRAFRLSERNKQLEKEIRDIDHLALSVEAECNATVKEHNKKIQRIQEKYEQSIKQISTLEHEVLELKRANQEQQADLEKVRLEKQKLRKQLDSLRGEKKKVVDKLNKFTVIEKDLMTDIDRLTQLNSLHKRKVAELENKLLTVDNLESSAKTKKQSTVYFNTGGANERVNKPGKKKRCLSAPPSPPALFHQLQPPHVHLLPSPLRYTFSTEIASATESCITKEDLKNFTPIFCKLCGVPYPREEHLNETMDIQIQQLRAERDHFRREYQNLLQQMQTVPTCTDLAAGDAVGTNTIKRIQAERDQYKMEAEKLESKIKILSDELTEKVETLEIENENNMKLRHKLSEVDGELARLHSQIQDLNLGKQQLQDRIDSQIISTVSHPCVNSSILDPCGNSAKVVVCQCLKKLDLAKEDVHRLEEERDALRKRLKVATEIQLDEFTHLQKTLSESEERIKRLEQERQDLMSSAGVQNATINKLEEELEILREKYQSLRKDLSLQRTSNTQNQSLQENTERVLAESRGQLSQLEAELSNAQERVCNLERDRAQLDEEMSRLKTEQSVLRDNLAKVDQEKDLLLISIDTKTEQIAKLDHHVKMSDKKILDLEGTVIDLQKKVECSVKECAVQESAARSAERDVEELRCELQALERTRDGVMRENRRLQDDLACSTRDVCQANANLAAAREEVETLKRQLQEYVAEIRRVEDQLASKEHERTEMLEHFRGLTVEATMLETNNHTLESETQETKRQLCMANERIHDLEIQLENRDSLVQSYENQIQELTANIAKLETQLQEFLENRQKSDRDVEELRMLCMKLDNQKDGLKQQIQQHDIIKLQLESELSRLQDQQEYMQEHLCKDQSNIASLESMLTSSRKETSMQRKMNEELRSEVRHLQQKVDCLQAKLESETAELQRCQYQANEYRNQIKDLQHQITNERFENARGVEEQKRPSDPSPRNNYPSNQGCSLSFKCGNNWEQKTSVMRSSGGSCGGDVLVNRKSYLVPPPCSDWNGLRAALDRECSTYTTEPGTPRQEPCYQSCPFIPRPRPTYVTGPRPMSPKGNILLEGTGSQSMFLNAKDIKYLNRSQFTSPCRSMPYNSNSDTFLECPKENETKCYPGSIYETLPSCKEEIEDSSYSTTL